MIPFSIQFSFFDCFNFVMYKTMKTLIGKKFYKTAEVAQNKLEENYAANRLSDDEYIELTALVQTVYTDEETAA